MNVLEALNVALPELPVTAVRVERPPRLDSTVIAREQMEEGRPVVLVLIPELHRYYTLEPHMWTLLQLFDGERSYAEIAALYTEQTGAPLSEEEIRSFVAETHDAKYWYRSAQEKNIALWETLKEERRKRVKKKPKYGDLAEISFSAWDPDKFLTKLHDKIGFVFSRWFVSLNLVMFAFMIYVFVSHWSQIGHDTLELYTFTDKGAGEIIEIWLLLFTIGFIHETAHGLGTKHTGGGAHQMGLLLIYLSPAFFCDTTEAWVYGNKWQRMATLGAGIWSTMLICSLATFYWWGTAPGTTGHNFAYLVMLIAGLLPATINLNPLIKLDGYFILTEFLEIADLKENSTAFLSAWVRRNIFALPVEVPVVTRRRAALYVPYAILSALYSYTLLFVVVRFVYNIAHSYSPDWAFVLGLYLAWLVFKGRILTLGRFMKVVYLDKKDRVAAWLDTRKKMALAVAAVIVLFAPVWRETVDGPFIVEPARRAVLRATVPGTVIAVKASEGDRVAAGAPVLQLRNLALESSAGWVASEAQLASARTTEAQLRYADYGVAESRAQQLATRRRLLQGQVAALTIVSPIDGIVATPRLQDRLGSYLTEGQQVAEIYDPASLRARIYLPEAFVRKVRVGTPVALRPDGAISSLPATVTAISPAPSKVEAGLGEMQEYKGVQNLQFYPVTVSVESGASRLRDGTAGYGKILVRRRSLAGMSAEAVYDFLRRKLW